MAIAVGRCAGSCGQEVWFFVNDPKTGERVPLWPRPSSRYPIFETADGNEARGIAYCAACCPAIGGEGPAEAAASVWSGPERLGGTRIALGRVKAIETAKDRYARWFSDEYGVWLRAWLRDHLALDETRAGTIEATVAEWERDRAA